MTIIPGWASKGESANLIKDVGSEEELAGRIVDALRAIAVAMIKVLRTISTSLYLTFLRRSLPCEVAAPSMTKAPPTGWFQVMDSPKNIQPTKTATTGVR